MSKVYYAGPAVEHTAGETLSGNRVVAIVDGEAFYASQDNPDHLHLVRGITVAAAMLGSTACIQIEGPMSEVSWNWTPKLPLYLSTNGYLTHTPPPTGFIKQIAVADTATRIFIQEKHSFEQGEKHIHKREIHTLSGSNITDGFIIIAQTPRADETVKLSVQKGGNAQLGRDFTMDVSNPKKLIWTGYALASSLIAGDVFEVRYEI